jgi:hypothetical protein
MKKLTKFESAIIIASLNNGMSNELAEIQKVEDAGITPIFTADFIRLTYADLIERIEKMSRKSN